MTTFKHLYGIKPSEIKKTCVISPFLTKGLTKDLGVDELIKGKPYSTGQSKHFTFIYSQLGGPMVGDCVLHLEETACENIILIGACGLVCKKDTLDIGSLVLPTRSYSLESFSSLLKKEYKIPSQAKADQSLIDAFVTFEQRENFFKVCCASVGSLKLEQEYFNFFKEHNIEVVEMECSPFFNAAEHINRRAMAFLYVTDIIAENNLFAPPSASDHNAILKAQKRLTNYLSRFIQ